MMDVIRFIYNKISQNGDFEAIHCDTLGKRDTIKVINNGKIEILPFNQEQQKELYEIISRFIDGSMDYDNRISEIEHTLMVSIGGFNEDIELKYYHWKEGESIPKGVEWLIEYMKKFE
jgi:hypothetical protein